MEPNEIDSELNQLEQNISDFSKLSITEFREKILDIAERIVEADISLRDQIKELFDNVQKSGESLIHNIVRRGGNEDLDRVCKFDVDVTITDSNKNNILHIAVYNKKLLLVSDILRKHIEQVRSVMINAQNKNGLTPLHYAVMNNQFDIVVLLLNAGAGLYFKDERGNTPLDMADFLGYEKIINIFKGNTEIENLNLDVDGLPSRSNFDNKI
ncbi:ankyrin repeat domain-containing protein [Candidatus Margulisiibacteriota bacterium]